MSRRILVIEDDGLLNTLLCSQLTRLGYETHPARTWREGERFLAEDSADLVLLDINLPDANGLEVLPLIAPQAPVIVLTAYGSVQTAVSAMKAGADEYLVKPIDLDELDVAITRALEVAALKREHSFIKARIARENNAAMIGSSPAMLELKRLIAAVAPSDITVLIQGESGVGKELVAHAIHSHSDRAQRNFVAVDCCTLQKHLFESELFGHEKGAFTGADRQKKGLIEGAEDGTLFLDEIGEIEPAIQAKLLRVLETGRYRRVGGTKDLPAHVRIVAATNRDLAAMSQEGGFRADLFYRLNGFALSVPPLRERKSDIPDLVRHFVANHDFSRRIDKTVHPDAIARLTDYPWPGNIRELRNMVERAIILSGDATEIRPEQFALTPAAPPRPAPSDDGEPGLFGDEPTLEEIKKRYLAHLLVKYCGHRSKVAQALGISERNTYRLIQKYDLEQ